MIYFTFEYKGEYLKFPRAKINVTYISALKKYLVKRGMPLNDRINIVGAFMRFAK